MNKPHVRWVPYPRTRYTNGHWELVFGSMQAELTYAQRQAIELEIYNFNRLNNPRIMRNVAR